MARTLLALVLLTSAAASAAAGQQSSATRGFEIREAAVLENCGACHVQRDDGTVERLSFIRKTPEGWEMSVRRMMTLHGVRLDTAAARAVVRYLADHQGLAPEEALPGRFEMERRLIDWSYEGDGPTQNTCRDCHSLGRAILQRRTGEEWELLVETHRALWPLVDGQTFRRNPPASGGGSFRQPMDQAISHLSQAFPLRTAEWAAWSATMRPPQIEGTWLVTGSEPGRGPLHGQMVVSRAASGDFETRISYRYASGGAPVTRAGRAIVYTGFQWRGRSNPAGAAPGTGTLREVLFVEPGWQEMSGRWFTGAYDELGVDVSMTRVTGAPQAVALTPRAIRRGTAAEVTIFGANLPSASAASIDFGPGVRVEQVLRATRDSIRVRVQVAPDAAEGDRDLWIGGAALRSAAVVYDQVHRIRVTPAHGMARIGGIVFPKQLQTFEAIGYSDGPDGSPNTDDDVEIGPVPVTWSVEEYAATFDDDDVRWVGALAANGVFTPAVDGPNPLRSASRNNIGDVWVVASYQPSDLVQRPVRARSMLVVTVPLYLRFDPWTAPR